MCLSTSRGLSWFVQSAEKSHRSGLIKQKCIFSFNHFCSPHTLYPYCWTSWVFKPGKGWFETRGVFPEMWLTHSSLPEAQRSVEAAIYTLVLLTTHTFPDCHRSTEKPVHSEHHGGGFIQCQQLGWGRSTGMAGAGKGSAGEWTDHSCLREHLQRHQGDGQNTALASAQSSCVSLDKAHPTSPAAKEDNIIVFLPFLLLFSVCLCGPSSCHGTVQHWWGHCWTGENYDLLQPLWFNLTSTYIQGSESPKPYSHLCFRLVWSKCRSLSDLTQITNQVALAGSA